MHIVLSCYGLQPFKIDPVGGWVAKLVARLLAIRKLYGFESRHLSTIHTKWAKEWPTHSSQPKKIGQIYTVEQTVSGTLLNFVKNVSQW
jgi:hypothetical protein